MQFSFTLLTIFKPGTESHGKLFISEIQVADTNMQSSKSLEILIDGNNMRFDVEEQEHSLIEIMI